MLRGVKESLTSFDIRVLVRELQALQGAYLDKVYQDGDVFLFRFNLPQGGKPELFVHPGRWLFLGEEFAHPPEPPALAQRLRASIQNAQVQAVRQKGFDRIVMVDLRKETDYALVFEMFGRGNLVLLREGEILHARARGRWRAREIRPGVAYRFPPEGANPADLDRASLGDFLREAQRPLVKVLATNLGLGGLYAEEVCLRADLPKTRRTDTLEPPQVDAVYETLQELLRQAEAPNPALVREGGRAVDAVPFPLRSYEGCELVAFPTLSEALQAFVAETDEEAERVSPEMERIERRIRQQEEVLREGEAEALLAGEAADHLYAHYQEVDRLLRRAQEGTFPEGVDRVRGVVRLTVGDHVVELDYGRDVEANARRFYERKKELADRAGRVREALAESQQELDRVRAAAERAEPPRRVEPRPRRKFWFDAYRWTLSGEGFLILAGRDARSNEKLVRKHLEPGDRYVHAELPGAPSVVVKDGGRAGEATLREACRFALVHSKAWRLGLGGGSAYWVTPEQVSKTAQSGEYLKTGAFVVRGKRNYVHNLELILGVGEVEVEGTHRVVGGDPEAVRARADRYLVLKPGGRGDRGALASFLSATFEVPREEVERTLPAGTFEIVEAQGVNLEGWVPR